MPKNIFSLCIVLLGCVVIILNACSSSRGFNTLRWPPDTIKAVRVWGNIYEVTTSPVAKDPKMNVILIWPPDTITQVSTIPPSKPWPPDTIEIEAMLKSTNVIAKTIIWPPDTTNYPSQILMIWPPDTTK
ncbi:MAG: hypothetical protein C0417_02000 [Chlorobiaceae bacterium]|nr:hypothetical protein [Chlorobiaceae bacterium]